MRKIVRLVMAFAVLVVVAVESTAEAKDLSTRGGVGYQNTLVTGDSSFGGSSVAARYFVNKDVFLDGQLGFSSLDPDAKGADSESNFGIGVGGGYVFIDEPNMNVFALGGLSFGSVAGTSTDPATGATETEGKTAIGLRAGMGMEFFLVGLPNLGLTAAFGLSYGSVEDVGSTIEIGGGDFATFGIRYYFGGPKGPASP